LVLARAGSVAGSLAGVIVLGRALGPAEYGRFVLVVNLAGLVAMFVFSLIGNSTTRFYAAYRARDDLRRFYATVAKGHGVLALGLLVLAGATARFWLPGLADLAPAPATVLASLGVLVFSPPLQQYIELLRFAGRPATYAGAATGDAFLRVAAPLGAIALLGLTARASLYGLALYATFGAAAAWVFMAFSTPPDWRSRFDFEFLRYGAPFVVMGLPSWVLGVSARYWIQYLSGAADAGRYAALYSFASAPVIAGLTALMLAIEPALYQHQESHGDSASAGLVDMSIGLVLVVLVPVTLATGFLHPVVPVMLGKGYGASLLLGWFVAGGTLAQAVATASQVRFLLDKRSELLLSPVGIAAAVNVAANVSLIPRFGIVGAAAATLLAYATQLGITIFLFRRVGARYPLRITFPLLATGLLAVAAGESAATLLQGIGGRMLALAVALAVFGVGTALSQQRLVRRAYETLLR
jgi:O-antigen/teichoic acid export membrane protein